MNIDHSSIEYTSQAMTLGEGMLMWEAQHGNWVSLANLIQIRTNLTMEQIKSLDLEDSMAIITKIAEALQRAETLRQLGKQL